MKTLYLYIMGGLGNQLYQYSYAKYLMQKYGFEKLIILTNNFEKFKLRNLEIQNFVLDNNTEFSEHLGRIDKIVISLYRIYQRVYRTIFKRFARQKSLSIGKKRYCCTVTETDFDFLDDNDNFLYGYFVSSDIAVNVKNIMNEEIRLKKISLELEKYINIIKSSQAPIIGVSVRCGGDYEKYMWPICSKEFYITGVKKIMAQVGECNLFIFADDVEKVKREHWFDDYENATYISDLTVVESFELLRNCNHYVCSNSSFSWWGGFLSYSKSAIKYYSDRVYNSTFQCEDKKTRLDDVIYLNYLTGEESDL